MIPNGDMAKYTSVFKDIILNKNILTNTTCTRKLRKQHYSEIDDRNYHLA